MPNLQEALSAFSQGQLHTAQNICANILSESPNCSPALHLIGLIAQQEGNHHIATEYFQKALLFDSEAADIYYNLAASCLALDKIKEATQLYEKAIDLLPDYSEAHYNLGNIYTKLQQLKKAEYHYQSVITLKPNFGNAHYNLGNVYAQFQQFSKAEYHYRRGVELQPEHAQSHSNLGFSLLYQGKIDHALESFRKAFEINSAHDYAQDNLLLSMHYADFLSPLEVFAAHRSWGASASKTIRPLLPIQTVPKQKIRIGYLSPDFRDHSVSYFFEPLLASHDTEVHEIFCYSCQEREDETTKRLRSYASHWRICSHLSDGQISEQIRADQIDILVDLAGHTTNNRLRVLAYKPSPIQITYLGYPGTSGLPTVDYRLTDNWADPETNDIYYTEKLIRLETGFLCYASSNTAPPVSSSPALRNGYITFGSFNNLPKINPSVVALWAKVLKAVPNSRLLLKSSPFEDLQTQADYREQFGTHGITADRLSFLGRFPSLEDHLACYGQIDIALDPFPYNGTTTTCESLWMGVPVITLAGTAHANRVGVSLLSCLGLEECIADTPKQYIQIAKGLAQDKQKLEDFRASIRFWMAASPLCDAEAFTRHLEDIYEQLWKVKCDEMQGS